eukprot:TRINITY_DN11250_c0_g1_i1.p1 TRINITY_DN11250_c0_g1~~TRINITY_DN11250_c0_g1_i1.p1  ORF type:complete len:68 (-),score=10.32 TRINITY_DN11250_c0_g1_i1:766-969(-)
MASTKIWTQRAVNSSERRLHTENAHKFEIDAKRKVQGTGGGTHMILRGKGDIGTINEIRHDILREEP